MNPIDEIKTKLRNYPSVKHECTDSTISLLPLSDTGFTVRLDIARGSFVVSFNGWHESFADPSEALNCFAFGLSNECRLKEHRRGAFAYRWTVESRQTGKWVADSETGLLVFPFWRRVEVVYLQNNLILGTSGLHKGAIHKS